MVPSLESFVSVGVSSNKAPSHNNAHDSYRQWNWKCYNCVATARFDRNGKMQPTVEWHMLQLKHSGTHEVLLPLLFDLRHRVEAAEAVGIAKLVFPKPKQHWKSVEIMARLMNKPEYYSGSQPLHLKVALRIAGLATHGMNIWSGSSILCWTEHWVLFRSLNLLKHKSILKQHNLQLMYAWQTSPKPAEALCTSLFWSRTTCNLHFWENDRTSGIAYLCFYSYSLIAGNSTTVLFGARYKISWNHGTSDEQTRVLRWFTAPTSKVALGIAGLAKHGINKLVQAASADPNVEFCSILSVCSSWWSKQKCIEWDHGVSQNSVRSLFFFQTIAEKVLFITKVLREKNMGSVSGTMIGFRKIPGIRNQKLKTCLRRLGIRLSISSRASFFNAKSFSTGTRFGPWRAQGPKCCASRKVYNQCNAVLDFRRWGLRDQVS